MSRRLGPIFVAFVACVWLNQSFGLLTWEKIRYGVFTDPRAHVFDTLRYPLIFLYRRSADEAMYYGTASQILGEPYDHAVFPEHTRGAVSGVALFDAPPPPADGHWHMPWTEVPLEYPPPVVPFMVAPKLVTRGFEAYGRVFGLLMGACMVGAIALAIDVLRRARAPREALDSRWWLAAALLLAQGALAIQRLDAIVALALIAAVHGAVRRSPWQLGLFAALAGACKIVPVLALPVIVASDWAFWRARLVRLGAWAAAGLAAGFAPMVLASPGTVLAFLRYHGGRGLQVESTLGVLVGAVRWVAGAARPSVFSYGSFNLDGAVPDALAKITLPLTLAAIAVLAARELRAGAPRDELARIERVTCAALAATAVLWLGGKVFSPQYLTWGIPLVLAIPGPRGVRASRLAFVALVLTQVYHRGFYSFLTEQRFVGLFTVLARQAVLVVLLALALALAARGASGRPRSIRGASLVSGPGARAGLARALSWAVLAGVAGALLSGFFVHLDTLGAHDWDQMESHRYFVVKSLRDFGRFPFWDPYGCGGFPSWGAPESGTIVVSPFLPVYLALPLAVAVRIEVVTMIVLLLLGCHFFARRYVEDPLALGFACLVGALNSRTALQAAVGHTWHLAYAGLPWVLGAFDRAIDARPRGGAGGEAGSIRLRWVAAGAAVLALMVYAGGVYPVPQTALCLIGLSAYRGCAARSGRPLLVAAAIGIWGALLAAPKLLPTIDTMMRFPRFTRSRETVEPLQWAQMFLSSADGVPDHRVAGLDYLWHEYGQYVGLLPLALLLWANLRRLPPDPAVRSLRFVGWALMLLALGGWGPWVVLHAVPLFRSQHVPTRFTYPAFMLLAVVAASEFAGHQKAWREKLGPARFAALAWGAFLVSAALVAREDARCTAPWFNVKVPESEDRTDRFVQYADVPPEYAYGSGEPEGTQGTNGAPGLLLRRANVGALRCSGFAGLNQDAPRAADGRPVHLGARGIGDPLYRGEFRVEPSGSVEQPRWAPGEVELSVHGAPVGSLLVLNQNWDPGWTANGFPTENHGDVNAYRLRASSGTVVFRYRPRTLPWALALFAVGALLVPAAWGLRRRVSRL